MANFDVNDIPPEVMKELTKCDCKAEKLALLDRVEKIIGEDEEQCPSGYRRNEIEIRNKLRAEQRKNLQKVVE